MESGGLRSIQIIVSSLREAIRSQADQNHEPTPTEYFAAIVALLKDPSAEHLPEFLQILAPVLPNTNKSVVQSQFKFLTTTIISIMRAYSDDVNVLKNCIDIVGSISCSVESSDGFWSKSDSLRVINAIFSFVDDSRTILRNSSCKQLTAVMALHKSQGSRSVRSYAADFCSEVLKTCTRSNYKRSLHIVMFLESALPVLLDSDVVKLFRQAVSLVECEQPILTASVFRTIDCTFQSSYISISPSDIASLLKLLLEQQGRSVDMRANTLLYSSISSGILSLHKSSPSALSMPQLGDYMHCFIFGCESNITEIHCAIGNALKRIMNVYIAVTASFRQSNSASPAPSELVKYVAFFAEHLIQLLSPQYQNSWLYIMDAVRFYFERVNMTMSLRQRTQAGVVRILAPMARGMAGVVSMISAAMLHVSPGADSALEVALASALSTFGGPLCFIKVLVAPEFGLLENDGELTVEQRNAVVTTFERNRVWLLRFLKRHLKNIPCSLDEFASSVLPLIDYTKHTFSSPRDKLIIVEDLWSLFPEFCASYDCRDVVVAFPKLVGTISSVISGYCREKQADSTSVKESNCLLEVSPIFLGLTNIAKVVSSRNDMTTSAMTSPNKSEAVLLSGYAPTILPLLITFLEVSELNDRLFQNAIHCLEAWSSLSPPILLANISKKMLQLLLINSTSKPSTTDSSDDGGVTAAKWMSIILTLIPKLSPAMVQLLYRTVKPLLSVNEAITVQKRSYLVLRALLANRPREVFEKESPKQVLEALGESFLLCHVSARSMRLECMELVIRAIENEQCQDQENSVEPKTTFADICNVILGEVLISQKDSNRKCRLAAISLLRGLVQRVPSGEMLVYLCSAVAGETPTMRSSAIGGLAVLLQEKRYSDVNLLPSMASLIPTLGTLLTRQNVEETRAILSLYKVFISSASSELLLPLLPNVIRGVLETSPEIKSKFQKKTRTIVRKAFEKFGSDVIRPMLPPSDEGLLTYLERQQRKKDRKKGQSRAGKSNIGSEVAFDSDEDNADETGSSISAFTGTHVGAKSVRDGRSDSIDDLTMLVGERYGRNNEANNSDYRLDKRGKATYAELSDVGRTKSGSGYIPMTLDDLMEDQGPTKGGARSRIATSVASAAHNSGRKRRANNSDDGGSDMEMDNHSTRKDKSGDLSKENTEKYLVRFDDSGVLVIEENNADPESIGTRGFTTDDNAKDSHVSRASVTEPQKKRKAVHEPGQEYRSKHASGDVWKRGMLEPHAYVPLDGRFLAKKNTENAVSQFSTLVRGGKGAKKIKVNTKHNTLPRSARRAKEKNKITNNK